jgi:hypothetical protein
MISSYKLQVASGAGKSLAQDPNNLHDKAPVLLPAGGREHSMAIVIEFFKLLTAGYLAANFNV